MASSDLVLDVSCSWSNASDLKTEFFICLACCVCGWPGTVAASVRLFCFSLIFISLLRCSLLSFFWCFPSSLFFCFWYGNAFTLFCCQTFSLDMEVISIYEHAAVHTPTPTGRAHTHTHTDAHTIGPAFTHGITFIHQRQRQWPSTAAPSTVTTAAASPAPGSPSISA